MSRASTINDERKTPFDDERTMISVAECGRARYAALDQLHAREHRRRLDQRALCSEPYSIASILLKTC
jgi:hypothetical protein